VHDAGREKNQAGGLKRLELDMINNVAQRYCAFFD
jgi:hypothetical protein